MFDMCWFHFISDVIETPSYLAVATCFADDTIVYLTITSDIDSVSLQDDLNKLAKWEERWKLRRKV
jgi:hypothetical protein